MHVRRYPVAGSTTSTSAAYRADRTGRRGLTRRGRQLRHKNIRYYQVLSVALGAGGVGALLAGSISTWLTQRHSDITLIVEDRNGRRVEFDAQRVRDVPQLLDKVAQMLDEAQPSQTPEIDNP